MLFMPCWPFVAPFGALKSHYLTPLASSSRSPTTGMGNVLPEAHFFSTGKGLLGPVCQPKSMGWTGSTADSSHRHADWSVHAYTPTSICQHICLVLGARFPSQLVSPPGNDLVLRGGRHREACAHTGLGFPMGSFCTPPFDPAAEGSPGWGG